MGIEYVGSASDRNLILAMLVDHPAPALARYEDEGPGASTAVAMNDHYLPLLYSVGALADGEKVRFTHSGFQNGSISMRCFASEGIQP